MKVSAEDITWLLWEWLQMSVFFFFLTYNMLRWLSMHHCFSVPPLTEEISWTTKGEYAWKGRAQYQIVLTCSVTYKYHNTNISLSGGLWNLKKKMPSNPIRREWEQHRRGAGNSNFVQLAPAVTSLHLNEPLDNPQKYDPSKGGEEAVFTLGPQLIVIVQAFFTLGPQLMVIVQEMQRKLYPRWSGATRNINQSICCANLLITKMDDNKWSTSTLG